MKNWKIEAFRSLAVLGAIVLSLQYLNRLEVVSPISFGQKSIDRTSEAGFLHSHSMASLKAQLPEDLKRVAPWITSLGAHLAVTDVNRDGYPDIFVGASEPETKHRFFVNDGLGHFKDQAERILSDSAVSRGYTWQSLFFDCDRDGDQDLVLLTSGCPKVFRNDSGSMIDITAKAGLTACASQAGNVLDFDNDGRLDIVMATHEQGGGLVPDHFFRATAPGQRVALFKGGAECQFAEAKGVLPSKVGYTISVGIADLRDLNRKDIWLTTDYGSDHLFLDNGDGSYTDASQMLARTFDRHGMAFDVSYLNGEKTPFVYISHIHAAPYMVGGNTLWQWADGRLQNRARERRIQNCGHAWNGRFFDFNRDGRDDLIVVNGFFSAGQTMAHFQMTSLATVIRPFVANPKYWPALNGKSMSTNERNCLFMNQGDDFAQARAENNPLLDDLYDGRGVAVLDARRQGVPTVAIANQLQPFKLYQVEPPEKSHWLGITLEGRCSNRDGLGAKVSLSYKGDVLTKYYYPTNGFASQTDSALLFGLGTDSLASPIDIEIRWPSGFRQKMVSYTWDSYLTIVEGDSCEKH